MNPRPPALRTVRRALAPALAIALTGLLAAGFGFTSRPKPAAQPTSSAQEGQEAAGAQTAPPTGRPTPAAPPPASAQAGPDAPPVTPPAADPAATSDPETDDALIDADAGDEEATTTVVLPVESPDKNSTRITESAPRDAGSAFTGNTPLSIIDSRRPTNDELVVLGFKDAKIEDTIRFIVECTGKVVMLRLVQVAPTKITLINDTAISKHEALDLLFQAFRLNGIGVVETDRLVIIDLLTEIRKIQDPGVVLGPDADVMALSEDGLIVSKIFRIKQAKAEEIGEQLQEYLPDFATMTVSANSNQIILEGNVGLCKRMQMLIDALDQPAFVNVETKTYRLAYADASTISESINELFGASRTGSTTANRTNQRGRDPRQRNQASTGGTEIVNTSEQLRVVTLPQINAITVSAEPDILRQIEHLIVNAWDIPLSETEGDLLKIYDLVYADPVQVRDVLQTMLEGASGGGGAAATRGAGGRAGAGGDSSADIAVANIFRIDALPDTRQLVVISRTPANFAWLDSVIRDIDRPTDVGKPLLVELKHANAVEVSEQLNALLSDAGSNAAIAGQETGLTRGDVGAGSIVGGDDLSQSEDEQAAEITFPWQSRASNDERSPESSIIGKVRIVPIIRQNALMILATPEMQQAVLDIVASLDRPGRQVLISAVIAAVELNDEFAYGLRVSPDGIVTGANDNKIGGTLSSENTKDNFISIFDTSTLNVNVNVNFVLQALSQKTNVRIIQQPRIFTADNTEAVFFNGQEIPFITDSQTTDLGTLNQSFSYIPVGVTLNVRPRITKERDVSLEINLTLSNTVPGETLFGGAVLDRRTTETQAIVKNAQTIVLSGIRIDSETKISRKVPLLGDIPGLGPLLFTSYDNGNQTQELVAFVTPIVVDNPNENDENFNINARERLEQIALPLEQQLKNQYEPFDPNPVWRRDPKNTPPTETDGTAYGWKPLQEGEAAEKGKNDPETEGGGTQE